jgi:hypothetical protein
MLERQLLAAGENDEVLVPGRAVVAPTTMSMLHSPPAPPPPRSRSQDAAAGSAHCKRKVREPRPTVTERRRVREGLPQIHPVKRRTKIRA